MIGPHDTIFKGVEDVVVAFVVGLAAGLEHAVDFCSDVLPEDDVKPASVGWTNPD